MTLEINREVWHDSCSSRSLGNAREHEAPPRSENALQQIMTPIQVAALLQVHVKTVYRLAEQGIIPGNRIGRRWRFSKRDVLSLVSNKQRKTSTAGEPLGPVSRQGGDR